MENNTQSVLQLKDKNSHTSLNKLMESKEKYGFGPSKTKDDYSSMDEEKNKRSEEEMEQGKSDNITESSHPAETSGAKDSQRPRRGPWSSEEDKRLIELISMYGASNWVRISNALVSRTPKQCRERYHQNLKPSLNRSPITAEEGVIIEKLVAKYGKKWAEIARHLNGRSDNAVKNWWNGGANRRRRNSIQFSKSESDNTFQSTQFVDPTSSASFPSLPPQPNGYAPHMIHQQVGPLQGGSHIPIQQVPYPHQISPISQISFNTSMFGNQPDRIQHPTPGAQMNPTLLPPVRNNPQRQRSFDTFRPMNYNNNTNAFTNQNHGHKSALMASSNNINTSLPSLILPTKRRLLDENNPIERRHTYANNVYKPNNTLLNSNNSYTNLNNMAGPTTIKESISLGNSGQNTPFCISPLMTANSRHDSVSTFESPPFSGSANNSLGGTRRSSLNPDFFPSNFKDPSASGHKRNISQNSSASASNIPTRFSISGASSSGAYSNNISSQTGASFSSSKISNTYNPPDEKKSTSSTDNNILKPTRPVSDDRFYSMNATTSNVTKDVDSSRNESFKSVHDSTFEKTKMSVSNIID